jgi:hypothetical protein
MMKAVRSSKTSVNFFQTTWCNTSEDSHLHSCKYKLMSRESYKTHSDTPSGHGDLVNVTKGGTHSYHCTIKDKNVRFQDLRWLISCNVAQCSLVEVNRRFRCAYCLHHQGWTIIYILAVHEKLKSHFTILHNKLKGTLLNIFYRHKASENLFVRPRDLVQFFVVYLTRLFQWLRLHSSEWRSDK